MEYKLSKASDIWYESKVEINSLEDLKKLSEEYDDEDLLIRFTEKEIIIYDGYLE